MWLVWSYGFAAICFGLLAFVVGLCVGIEEERRRKRSGAGLSGDVQRKADHPDTSDLARLGIVRLD